MFLPDQYQLLDFGHARRLERFGPLVVDRPCPVAARIAPATPEAWIQAHAHYRRGPAESPDAGAWQLRGDLPERWTLAWQHLVFELKRAAQGQVGLFPEQADNWTWINRRVRESGRALRVLNLFAYTGAGTLVAAAAGAEVTHVDAARNIMAWARRNAALSGLAEAAIHWMIEDAVKFARRELRRGNRYQAAILDPPSYGHGPHGEVWRLSQHLDELLRLCAALTAEDRQFILLTCHTPSFGPARLKQMLQQALGRDAGGQTTADSLVLCTPDGRNLPSGAMVRWESSNERSHG